MQPPPRPRQARSRFGPRSVWWRRAARSLALGGTLLVRGGSAEAQPPCPGAIEPPPPADANEATRRADNASLLAELRAAHGLTDEQACRVQTIFAGSTHIGRGNPRVTQHPMTPETCLARARAAGVQFDDPRSRAICGGPYMAPLYDPATETPADARACIDRLEFPGIPCSYPVVWAQAREAAQLCEAMGKRLCDAHEWEGACAGAVTPPDYVFGVPRGYYVQDVLRMRRREHNKRLEGQEVWAYGEQYRKGVCGTSSQRSPTCNGFSWHGCGSNTFPAGAFPECKSALGVFDLHGNAAEHMNLPLTADQMASAPPRDPAGRPDPATGLLRPYGYTEMKGSWFVFDVGRAHPDHCRWRAPYWHGTRVMSRGSHRNYHLGFRCCRSVGAAP